MLEGSLNFIYLLFFLIQPFLVQYAAIFFLSSHNVPFAILSWEGALRDDTQNG